MARKTAADFDPEVLILFDAYVHGIIDRRAFLDRAAIQSRICDSMKRLRV